MRTDQNGLNNTSVDLVTVAFLGTLWKEILVRELVVAIHLDEVPQV